MSLEMSEHEVCTRFKRNGGGRRMIAILAQLNAVDDEVICNILLKHELLRKKPKIMHKYDYC